MRQRKIVIIGGSITGCGLALSVKKKLPSYTVQILERSRQLLSAQGAGVAMPIPLFQKLMQENYLDQDFKAFTATQRHFVIQDSKAPKQGRTIWRQSISAVSMHWGELFKNLYQRIPEDIYFLNHEVSGLDATSTDHCIIHLKNRESIRADLAICADGYTSLGRQLIYPQAEICRPGYHAWRGIVPCDEMKNSAIYEPSIPYYLHRKGHFLCYPIFENGQKFLNWLLFEKCSDEITDKFLRDRLGYSHKNSLLPGRLSDASQAYLRDYARHILPQEAAEIICRTENPFLQRIIDSYMPVLRKNRLIALGDAGTLLRPHIAFGAAKALQSAMSLIEYLANENLTLDQALEQWEKQQTAENKNLYEMSSAAGKALVLSPPDWNTMDEPKKMERWWQSVLNGKKWYVTDQQTRTNDCLTETHYSPRPVT